MHFIDKLLKQAIKAYIETQIQFLLTSNSKFVYLEQYEDYFNIIGSLIALTKLFLPSYFFVAVSTIIRLCLGIVTLKYFKRV